MRLMKQSRTVGNYKYRSEFTILNEFVFPGTYKIPINFVSPPPFDLLLYQKQKITSKWGRDSSVGTATRYGLDGPGIEHQCGARFSTPVHTGPEAHPASCTMGTGSFPWVKRPGRGVDHPPHIAPRFKEE